jgi:putative flippase GtrA
MCSYGPEAVPAITLVGLTGMNPTLASIIVFFVVFPISYLGHFRFTFAAVGRHRNYSLKFSIRSLASLLLSTIVVWTFTAIRKMGYKPTFIAAGIILPVGNYFVNRLWVFLQYEDGTTVSRTKIIYE